MNIHSILQPPIPTSQYQVFSLPYVAHVAPAQLTEPQDRPLQERYNVTMIPSDVGIIPGALAENSAFSSPRVLEKTYGSYLARTT